MVAKFRSGVCQSAAVVVVFTDSLEVALHHVDIVVIVFMIHSGVANYANAKLVKTVGDFAALLLPGSVVLSIEECLDINDGRLFVLKFHLALVDRFLQLLSSLFLLSLHISSVKECVKFIY